MNENENEHETAGGEGAAGSGGNTYTLRLRDQEIILIGTAHVSRESIAEVRRVIRETRPDVVCVELDEGRYNAISQNERWEKLDVTKVFKEGKGFLLIANLVLAGFQRRLGNELGVKPGEEMKTAVETAEELGIPHSLCDREVQITLRRAWARCGLWSKCKLLASLLSSAFTREKMSEAEIENLKNRSELDGMMSELSDYLPGVKETLIDERDRYLAAKIWTAGGGARRKTAVVGAGHLPGLQDHLKKIAAGEEAVETAHLDIIPPPGLFSRAAPWLIPVLIVALIALGFVQSGAGLSLAMLRNWLLWNGSLAALGCLVALGHPLSILVSFFGAPIGTLSPFVGVGLFSGLTELWLRKPRVSDTESLSGDLSSLRGIYRNRITRALLVFFLSTLGGAAGNIISIPALAGLLVK
ncbi:MAG: TraB/GumN family protein [Treponema sp.]|jgi:pheromone shutdown-related protein TraB|nr:TraB/GumN family protein [Treponema sp.]